MKALYHILLLALLTLGSCTSSLYTRSEYDDVYYSGSDKMVAKDKPSANEQVAAVTLKPDNYYNNIYAADTLVSDQYSDAVDYNDSISDVDNNYGGGYDYYDNYPYAARLSRFYGNYFNPYWEDPYYFDWGYPSMGFGFGGFPYAYNYFYPYSYGYFGDYYGGLYGGLYGLYGGFYGGFGLYYPRYYGYNEGRSSFPYGRRDRPSTLSSRYNSSMSLSTSSRRNSFLSSGGSSEVARRLSAGISGNQTIATDQRRSLSNDVKSQQAVNSTGNTSGQRNSANIKPEYSRVNRTYTPSYSNPRMSSRPSYNNSRVKSEVNRNNGSNRVYNSNSGSVRTPSTHGSYWNPYNVRSNSVYNGVQRRSGSSSGYSVPTIRSMGAGRTSSGSYSNSSSGGSRSSSSYSSGSSGSDSRSSSSSSSGSSGSSSGGSSRRR